MIDRGAPFVYFDFAPTYGIMNGAVQVELGARVLLPGPDGEATAEVVQTGHLRCSPAAAQDLISALTKALAMFQNSMAPPEARSVN